jgi:hypothetical protein
MHIAKQLAIFLENRPGTLARLCQVLSQSKINIDAISTGDTVDHNVVRLLVQDTKTALRIFEEHGSLVVETEVLVVDADNKPGRLAEIAEALAAAKINIDYCYGSTSSVSKQGALVLRVSNTRKALKVLNSV